MDRFERPIREKFEASFQDEHIDWSSNIDPLFYDRTSLQHALIQHPELERDWKIRIICTNSPRGNIVMYYHVFKEAFAYYSDQSNIPYRILNALAMKYSMMFRCRNWFIDEQVLDQIHETSPFLELYKQEEQSEIDKKKELRNKVEPLLDALSESVFVKSKIKNQKQQALNNMTPVKRPIPQQYRNKFLHMGKINNLNVIQRQEKTNNIRTMSYQEFKHFKKGGSETERMWSSLCRDGYSCYKMIRSDQRW